MKPANKPTALILVSTHCPHCHALEKLLHQRMENGSLGELEVVNFEHSPEVAQQYGVRSVPWLRLGNFVFDEALTPADLDRWIGGTARASGAASYIAYLLEKGKLNKAIEWIEAGNASLSAILPVLQDPDVKINVRVGVSAILEHFEDTNTIRAAIPALTAMLGDSNPTVRIDVCHYLSLTHSIDVVESLKTMLEDEDEQVRQVARESIEALQTQT